MILVTSKSCIPKIFSWILYLFAKLWTSVLHLFIIISSSYTGEMLPGILLCSLNPRNHRCILYFIRIHISIIFFRKLYVINILLCFDSIYSVCIVQNGLIDILFGFIDIYFDISYIIVKSTRILWMIWIKARSMMTWWNDILDQSKGKLTKSTRIIIT